MSSLSAAAGVARAGPSGSCGSAARPGMGPSEASRRGNDGPSSARRGETPPEQRARRGRKLCPASLCRPRRVPCADPAAGGSDRPSRPARAFLGLCCLSCAVVLAGKCAHRAPPSCAGLAWRLRRLRGLRPRHLLAAGGPPPPMPVGARPLLLALSALALSARTHPSARAVLALSCVRVTPRRPSVLCRMSTDPSHALNSRFTRAA